MLSMEQLSFSEGKTLCNEWNRTSFGEIIYIESLLLLKSLLSELSSSWLFEGYSESEAKLTDSGLISHESCDPSSSCCNSWLRLK